MKTLIASAFAIMVLASAASASSGHFVTDEGDHFGTDRFWVDVGQGNQ